MVGGSKVWRRRLRVAVCGLLAAGCGLAAGAEETKGKNMEKLLSCPPSVFAVGEEYQVCALVDAECTMWVEVAGENYYDHSNGILRSGRFLHIAHVPLKELERAKGYTLHLQRLNERKPYFTDYGEVESSTYAFRPVRAKAAFRVVNLADAHNTVAGPIGSGSFFGDKLDILILNGDIPNHSGDINYFKAIYQIAGGITKGEIPCVFSRGNHDMRGIYAEQLADYTPTDNGRSYFTFRLGPVWGIVLDAGEDKADDRDEYGRTICCSAFRREEEAFLDRVIKEGDYKTAKIRLVVSHHPFAHRIHPPFDIEQELYARWCRKLKKIRPTVWLTGHLHECFQEEPGGAHDTYGYPCTLVCSSRVRVEEDGTQRHVSGAVTIHGDGRVETAFIDQDGQPWSGW